VWSEKTLQVYELVAGLVKILKTLNSIDVAASPICSEYCEGRPEVCWKPTYEPETLLVFE